VGTGKVGQIRCALFGEVRCGELCFGKLSSGKVRFGSCGGEWSGMVRHGAARWVLVR